MGGQPAQPSLMGGMAGMFSGRSQATATEKSEEGPSLLSGVSGGVGNMFEAASSAAGMTAPSADAGRVVPTPPRPEASNVSTESVPSPEAAVATRREGASPTPSQTESDGIPSKVAKGEMSGEEKVSGAMSPEAAARAAQEQAEAAARAAADAASQAAAGMASGGKC
jgi:hypothetical protein